MKKIYLFAEYILMLIAKTWRIKTNDIPNTPAVVAFWHSNMLPVYKLLSNANNFAIVSMNKDGDILSHLLNKWNYQLIRGSSSKNGKEVINKAVNLNENKHFLITPDGPRGPRQQFKAGTFVIAQRKQVPIYIINCKIYTKKVFYKSWDKFILPLPFSKIEIIFSEAINVPLETTYEDISLLIAKYSNIN